EPQRLPAREPAAQRRFVRQDITEKPSSPFPVDPVHRRFLKAATQFLSPGSAREPAAPGESGDALGSKCDSHWSIVTTPHHFRRSGDRTRTGPPDTLKPGSAALISCASFNNGKEVVRCLIVPRRARQ